MTRADLERVYYLKKDLAYWQERRANLEADIAPPIKNIDGMPFAHTNAITDPTQDKAIKLAQTARIIDGKINEIQIAIAEIDQFILSLDDPLLRQIIIRRCVQCMTWAEVARTIGNQSADTVRQIYHRFVTQISKKDAKK